MIQLCAFLSHKNCHIHMLSELSTFSNFLLYLCQMLCEERGLFLEIADIIRGLGLTILKGLMETRNDKIWAHFAVEVMFLRIIPLMFNCQNFGASLLVLLISRFPFIL